MHVSRILSRKKRTCHEIGGRVIYYLPDLFCFELHVDLQLSEPIWSLNFTVAAGCLRTKKQVTLVGWDRIQIQDASTAIYYQSNVQKCLHIGLVVEF